MVAFVGDRWSLSSGCGNGCGRRSRVEGILQQRLRVMPDGVLLGLRPIAEWVVGGWFVAVECYRGSWGSGSGGGGTGSTTLVFVVVELTETTLVDVESSLLRPDTLRFLGCCEHFGDRSFGSFVLESGVEELRGLGGSGVEVLLRRRDSSCRRCSGGGCPEIVTWIAIVELEVDVR